MIDDTLAHPEVLAYCIPMPHETPSSTFRS